MNNNIGDNYHNKKILVLYATHIMNDNMRFFMKHGVIKNSPNIDFLFVFNNPDLEMNDFKDYKNVWVIKQKNTGIDFGAWSYGLLFKETYKQYDYFVFVNSTVRGPFLPTYIAYLRNKWVYLFLDKLNNEVKLVGTTINYCDGKAHVQSMMMATDRKALDIALRNKVFKLTSTKDKKFKNLEKRFSRCLTKHGYNIACMQSAYKDVDFRKPDPATACNKEFSGDPYFPNAYFGINVHPYEVIFIKTNRDITPEIIDRLTSWHNKHS